MIDALNLSLLLVTPYNIAYLQELVRNGPMVYPGARYVVKDTSEGIGLRYNKRADAIFCWIAKRHPRNGGQVTLTALGITVG